MILRGSSLTCVCALFLLAAAGVFAEVVPDDRAEAFFDAARTGDLETVRRMHTSGLDVNTPSRYGATALSFACDKGQLDVVRYLVENGADVNVEDTFYGFTPVGWALFNDHDEIVVFLMGHGSSGADNVLLTGVRKKNAVLIRSALGTGEITSKMMDRAMEQAAGLEDGGEIVALLESADVKPTPAPVELELPDETLANFAGKYQHDASEMVVEVRVDGKRLVAIAPGNEPQQLIAIAENQFRAVDGSGLTVTFSGRGGIVENVQAETPNGTQNFRPVEATADAAASEPADTAATDAAATAPKTGADAGEASAVAMPISRGKPRNWPSFRGADASGNGDGQGAPVRWNGETGENIAWKTPIPGLANASPVIWGDRVFILTAISGKGDDTFRSGLYGDVGSVDDESEHTFKVYALDRNSGEIVWERTAASSVPGSKRHTKATQANSTPVTNGKVVVSLFGSIGLLVAHDLDGNEKWSTRIGNLDAGWFYDKTYQWGHASSPIIYKDLVIVQADVQKDSYIAAYRLKDGSEAWKTSRDEIPTWGSPTVVRNGKHDELVTNGTTIRGYDPATGKELWTLGPNSEVTVATPIVADGIVYVTAGYPPVRPIYAIRPGGRGDLTLSDGAESSKQVAWSKNRDGTYMPTPIAYRGTLYTCANNGRMIAYDAATGEERFRARVFGGGSFTASPIAADGRLYFSTEEGDVLVIAAGGAYEEISRNPMGEVIMSTPAVSDGVMVVRTLHHVFGITEPRKVSAASGPDATTSLRRFE